MRETFEMKRFELCGNNYDEVAAKFLGFWKRIDEEDDLENLHGIKMLHVYGRIWERDFAARKFG